MLTEKQKIQIRYMVSANPAVENMERVAALSDEDVLAELEIYKTNELAIIEQEINQVSQELGWNNSRLNILEGKKQTLEGEVNETI